MIRATQLPTGTVTFQRALEAATRYADFVLRELPAITYALEGA